VKPWTTLRRPGNKALVFSRFRQPQFGGTEWIAVELAKHAPINYCEAKSDRARERLLQDFSQDPERKVFIGHPKTAGLGLNQLVAANYVIHKEQPVHAKDAKCAKELSLGVATGRKRGGGIGEGQECPFTGGRDKDTRGLAARVVPICNYSGSCPKVGGHLRVNGQEYSWREPLPRASGGTQQSYVPRLAASLTFLGVRSASTQQTWLCTKNSNSSGACPLWGGCLSSYPHFKYDPQQLKLLILAMGKVIHAMGKYF
jgi:hypothetical protein